MTVTTKATTTSTTIRQPDKYNFLPSLLTNNGSSHLISSTSSDTEATKKGMDSESKYNKLFKSWKHSKDSEYKTIEKAFGRFQSKDRNKIYILKTIVIPWLKKNTIENTTNNSLQNGRLILLKWWNLLVSNLLNVSYSDRSIYFESILTLITRNEFKDLDDLGPIPIDATNVYMGIPLETLMSYRTALMTTLQYAIDRLNQKGVYSNVISFCARVLALCFFKIPGVGFALLQALPVSRSHIKRILQETINEKYSSAGHISKQNEILVSLFPEHLKIICFLSLKTWWRQFENSKRIWDDSPIEMSGNWIRRWQSDDSELFFSFYKHYHIVLKSYLSAFLALSASPKSMTPPFQYITAPGYIHLASFFLLKIESLIHRDINNITSVIQFERPRNSNNSIASTLTMFDTSNRMNSNAVTIEKRYSSVGIVDKSAIDGEIANENIAIGASMNSAMSNSGGKPKVLEIAGRRFIETMVSIVENGLFQEMCNIWIQAVVKKTNLYDVEGVFCLLDFIDTLITELDSRDNIIDSSEPITPNFVNTLISSNSFGSPFSPPNLIKILNITFHISLIRLLLDKSDHTITILRTISFVHAQFSLLTSQSIYLKQLVKEILLEKDIFERMFCHWSGNVRTYFMRLLVWRVGGIGNKLEKNENSHKDLGVNNDILCYGDNDNDEIVIDVLHMLQNRLDGIRQCHKYQSNNSRDIENDHQAIKSKIVESTTETSTRTVTDEEDQSHLDAHPSVLSSSLLTVTSDSKQSASSSSNKRHKHKKRSSVKEFITSQSSSSFIRWIFSNGSSKHMESTSITNSPLIPTHSISKQPMDTLELHYAHNRRIYSGKAIAEYDAINKDYLEWCVQKANGIFINGDCVTDDPFLANTGQFPSLVVEYPKHFGNWLGNPTLI